MRELVWEWLLTDGSTVRASLDRKRDEESVWVGRRLVSRAAVGTKPEGHRISASPYRAVEARVVFDPDAIAADRRCALHRGDEVVVPRTWPGQSRERLRRAVVTRLPIAMCMFAIAMGGVFAGVVASSRLSTHEVNRFAGPLSEAPVVGTATTPPPQIVPATARRRPIFRAPSPVPTIAPVAAPAVVAARPPPPRTLPAFLSPPPSPRTTFVSAPRTVPPTLTVDVVCDDQGACQRVKPVRLALTR